MTEESTGSLDGTAAEAPRRRSRLRVNRALRVTFAKFATTASAAFLTGQLTVTVLFWTHWTTAGIAAAVGFAAGALVNYFGNRRWTWGRRGRAKFRTEILPYLGIVALNGIWTVGVTKLLHMLVAPAVEGTPLRGIALNGSLLTANVLFLVLKFLLLDRVFGDRGAARTREAKSQS